MSVKEYLLYLQISLQNFITLITGVYDRHHFIDIILRYVIQLKVNFHSELTLKCNETLPTLPGLQVRITEPQQLKRITHISYCCNLYIDCTFKSINDVSALKETLLTVQPYLQKLR